MCARVAPPPRTLSFRVASRRRLDGLSRFGERTVSIEGGRYLLIPYGASRRAGLAEAALAEPAHLFDETGLEHRIDARVDAIVQHVGIDMQIDDARINDLRDVRKPARTFGI